MNPRDLLEAIRSRRSIRRYTKTRVPRAVMDELFDAARWAPSAHNRQPWRFAVIEAAQTKDALATAMGERLRADLTRDGAPRDLIDAEVSNSYTRIMNAPALIVVCLTLREMDRYPDPRRNQAEWVMAVQSTALAVQNLLLAAHARGLGACWMCAPLFVPETVRAVLSLADDWEPQALITLGYPAETRTKERMPLEMLVRYLDADEQR
jgi:coenzyme F420-0:L-glutamate ligase/coenzyme F420-1:gamma-L-glutamate ligase